MTTFIFKIRSAIYDFEVRNPDATGKRLALTLNSNVVKRLCFYHYEQIGETIPSEVKEVTFGGHLVFSSDFIPEDFIAIGYLQTLQI